MMTRLLVLLVLGASVGAEELPDGGPPGSPCPRAISPENAQALYAALKDVQSPDGCKLEEVRTENELMHVEWKKEGVSAPLIEIQPRACGQGATVTGPEFAMSAPAGALAACPAAVEKMRSIIASERLGGSVVRGGQADHTTRLKLPLVIGVLLLIAAVAIFIRRRKRQ